ncbi:MAG: hemerythrin domain-containing protein [Phycisphaerae bacterium]|nr:hemerythrin domain-containing protein [Phycisphaerae bacterium]
MSLSAATQLLVREHEVIERVVGALSIMLSRHETPDEFPLSLLDESLQFLTRFADCRHHAKEESHLFPAMEARGLPHDMGPIACMLHEHCLARGHIRTAQGLLERLKTGDAQVWPELRAELEAYVELIRNHIAKENQVLFVMADQLLTGEESIALHKRMLGAENALNAERDLSAELAMAKSIESQSVGAKSFPGTEGRPSET